MQSTRNAFPTFFVLSLIGGALAAQPQASPAKLPSPSDKVLIVLSSKDETANVLVVNSDKLDLLKSIKVGAGPQDVCFSPDGKKAYVTQTSGGVTVLDLVNLTVSATITNAGLQRTAGIAASADGKKVYVGARGSNALVVLSADGKVLKQVPVKDATTVVMSHDGKRVYVASDSTRSVLVVDTTTDAVVGTIKTGRQPRGIALTPDGKTILITSVTDDVLHFVNAATNEVESTIGIGRSPQSVAVTPDGQLAFSVTRDVSPGGGTSTVSIISLGKFESRRKIKDIPVDYMASKVVVNSDGLLYVTCGAAEPSSTVTVIELSWMRILRFAKGGTGASGMALRQ